jgi:hypothetical protein
MKCVWKQTPEKKVDKSGYVDEPCGLYSLSRLIEIMQASTISTAVGATDQFVPWSPVLQTVELFVWGIIHGKAFATTIHLFLPGATDRVEPRSPLL